MDMDMDMDIEDTTPGESRPRSIIEYFYSLATVAPGRSFGDACTRAVMLAHVC